MVFNKNFIFLPWWLSRNSKGSTGNVLLTSGEKEKGTKNAKQQKI